MIKKKVINKLLDSGLVQPYDVIEHSYTDNGKRELGDLIVSKNGVFPCMTTRPDCLGVVEKESEIKLLKVGNYGNGHHAKDVYDTKGVSPTIVTENHGIGQAIVDDVQLVGGIGEKKSNKGTQYYEQDRIYNGERLATAIPAEKSFHPYYTNKENMKLTIRKLTPKECIRLMGFNDNDYQAMREIGMTDSAIYHCAGDALITTLCAMLFATMLPMGEDVARQKVEKYIDSLAEK